MSGPEAIAFLKAKDLESKKSSRLKFESLKSKFTSETERSCESNSTGDYVANDEETMKIKALRRGMKSSISMDLRDHDLISPLKHHDSNGDFDAVTPRWARGWINNSPRRLSSRSTTATPTSFTPRIPRINSSGQLSQSNNGVSPLRPQCSSSRSQNNKYQESTERRDSGSLLHPVVGDGNMDVWYSSTQPAIMKSSISIENGNIDDDTGINATASYSDGQSTVDPPSIASSYDEESYASVNENNRIIDETRAILRNDNDEVVGKKAIINEWQESLIQMSDKLQNSFLKKDKTMTEWHDVFDRLKVAEPLSSSQSMDENLLLSGQHREIVGTRWNEDADLSYKEDKTLEVIGNVLLTTAESLASNAIDIGSKLSKGFEGFWSSMEGVMITHIPERSDTYETNDPTANHLQQLLSGHQEHEKQAIVPSHVYNLECDSDEELEDAIDGRWFNESHINRDTNHKPNPITYNFSDSSDDDSSNINNKGRHIPNQQRTSSSTPINAAFALSANDTAGAVNITNNNNEHLFTRAPYSRMDNESFSYDPLSNEFWASFLQKISESKKTNDSGAVYWGQRLIDSNTSNTYLEAPHSRSSLHDEDDVEETKAQKDREILQHEDQDYDDEGKGRTIDRSKDPHPPINQSEKLHSLLSMDKSSEVTFFHLEDGDDELDLSNLNGKSFGSDDDEAFYPMSVWTTATGKEGPEVENSMLIKACVKLDTPPYGGSKHIIEVSVRDNTLDVACEFCEQYRLANRTYHALACFLLYLEEGAESYPVTIECSLSDIVRCFEFKEVLKEVLEEVQEEDNEGEEDW